MFETVLHGIGAYARGSVIGPAKWPHHDLIVVTRGSANFLVRGRSLPCSTWSVFYIPPGWQFVGTAGESGCDIWVQHFRGKPASRKCDLRLPREPEIWHESATREWIRMLMQQASILQKKQPASSCPLQHILYLLLHGLLEDKSPHVLLHQSPARKIHSLIESLQTEAHPLPSLEELAERTGWSTSHFREQFARHSGRSAGVWLRELKMAEAARLLWESNLPVKEISLRLGYSDPVSFHRAFLNHTGKTPGAFRTLAPKVA